MKTAFIAFALAASPVALAHDGGMSGISTRGCGSCHGGSANSSVSAQISAPVSSVLPGDVVTITFALSSSSSSFTYGGLDVSATGGTLRAGSGTRVSSGDVTQSTARAFSGGGTSWDFTWTAPANAGTYKIRGAGNAVNHNRSDSGDGWHLAPDLTLTVAADCADADNDGVTTCDGDCDDHDAAVHPGADEICNGVDDNCDGQVDPPTSVDAQLWYVDRDGDGYGTGVGQPSCSQLGSRVTQDGDCNDHNANKTTDCTTPPADTDVSAADTDVGGGGGGGGGADTDSTSDTDTLQAGGCKCDSTAGAPSFALVALALATARRRRARR